ncbi:MAG: hypothetical protein VX498_05705 [Myxococcota bacterium]|nr:hypothetical protein [Myxococcota bacterium]
MSIAEQLLESPYREALVADATVVLNSEVADKRGLSGKFVKAGFAMVKGFKPGFIPHAIDDLLGDFVRQIEPFYLRWKESGSSQSCSAYFVANGPSVADALLAITDERAKRSVNRTLVKTYNKLRPKGKEHVISSMPRVGDLIAKHASALESA